MRLGARCGAPGVPISREAALHLIRCSDDDLPELLAAARAAKERFKPGVITYSRKVFLPLTNLCRDYCGYCTFRRDPGDPGAHTMTPGRSSRGRPRRRKTGMHRSPVQSRRQARTALPRDARDAAPSRLQVHAALSRSHVRTGAARDQPAAASESRPAQRGMDRAPGRRFAQHGPDARNHQRRPAGSRRGSRQCSRQSSGQTPAHHRRRRQAECSVHHRAC